MVRSTSELPGVSTGSRSWSKLSATHPRSYDTLEWRKGRPNDDRSKGKKNVHSECEEGGRHLRKWNRRAHVRDLEGAEWRERERERKKTW